MAFSPKQKLKSNLEALRVAFSLKEGERPNTEQLEQLRWLENGFRIGVVESDYDAVSVDVPADVERVEKLIAADGQA